MKESNSSFYPPAFRIDQKKPGQGHFYVMEWNPSTRGWSPNMETQGLTAFGGLFLVFTWLVECIQMKGSPIGRFEGINLKRRLIE